MATPTWLVTVHTRDSKPDEYDVPIKMGVDEHGRAVIEIEDDPPLFLDETTELVLLAFLKARNPF